MQLLTSQDPVSKDFREHIHNYNNALAMTSIGHKVDESINDGEGPYIFRLHGMLSHKSGSLLPPEGEPPVFAQLYIYNPADAVNFQMANRWNTQLDHHTMVTLQDMLHRHHPAVQMYKQAHELTRNMPPEQQCKIALRFDESCDHHCYNLPTAATDEITVILPGDATSQRGSVTLFSTADMGLPFSASQMCTLSILHFIMFCYFLLASFSGFLRSSIRELLAMRLKIRKVVQMVQGGTSASQNPSSIVIISILDHLPLNLSISS
jgi:hypothetical protein